MASLASLPALLFMSSLFLIPATSSRPRDPPPASIFEFYSRMGLSAPLTAFVAAGKSVPSCTYDPGDKRSCTKGPRGDPLEGVLLCRRTFRNLYSAGLGPNKLQTAAPRCCLTISTISDEVFVNGRQIVIPEHTNDGQIIVHGLDGFLAPLSNTSCNPDLMQLQGFERLSEMGVLNPLPANYNFSRPGGLHNMTVFFISQHPGAARFKSAPMQWLFHSVPNRVLAGDDLARLPVGTVLPTLARNLDLVVTRAGAAGGPIASRLRINDVAIKIADVIFDILDGMAIVHYVFAPFPATGEWRRGGGAANGTSRRPSPTVDLKDGEL